MGSQSSKNKIKKIDQTQWVTFDSVDDAQILRSRHGNGQGQLRFISADPKHEVDKEIQIYTYRNNTDLPLVKCLAAEFSKSQNAKVCGNQRTVSVLTERIPKRLSDIKKLKFPQALYVISQSLLGVQDLNEKAGRFEITDKMIGFNNNGQVKVWLNENFASNHPIVERPILQTTTVTQLLNDENSQQKMVKRIFNLVEKKCEDQKYPRHFYDYIKNTNKTYHDAYNSIQNYIRKQQIFVPAKINLSQSQDANSYQRNKLQQQSKESIQFQEDRNEREPIRNTIKLPSPIISARNTITHPDNFRFTKSPPKIISYNQGSGLIGSPRASNYSQEYQYGILGRGTSVMSTNQVVMPPVITFTYQSPENVERFHYY